MTRTKTAALPAVHVSSLLFICALLPALLFKGPQIEFFAITQIVLVLWLGWILLRSYNSGLQIPRSSLVLSLTLFWLWLALSLAWSLAPGISTINFWWVGSLVTVFWLYTLTPDRDELWSNAAAILLVLGLVAALMGIYQVQLYGDQGRSIFETRNTHAAFLNIIALPASAWLLMLVSPRPANRSRIVVLSLVLYILFLSLFLAASRGASISLLIGLALLIALVFRHVPVRGILLLLGLFAVAFLSAKFLPGTGGVGGELSERLPSLVQDKGRLVIWEASWNLLKDSPWYGIGLGLFYLAYPPYRNPADNSGGFFVHNDYLQIWIETGLPGLLLLLSVLITTLWLFVRLWRKRGLKKEIRLELAGLFCGLLAVAGHSAVDFNLYILSIMMIAGLALGRFHSLAVRELGLPAWQLSLSRVIGGRAFPVIVVLLLLFPVFYFVALSTANSSYDRALTQAQQGKLEQADRGLASAQQLTPLDDRALIAHADLFRHAAALLPADDPGRQVLYRDALRFLDQAEEANPLRGLTHVIRARLYQQQPDLAGEQALPLALESYRRALALTPKLFQARVDYANLLLQQGRKDEAYAVLEEGVRYEYHPLPELVPLYKLTAGLRREAGRAEEALILENKASELEKMTASSYYLRGY